MKIKPLCLLLFGISFLFISRTALAVPKVLVTLKPLHSLVANLMENVGEPQLIVPDGASPHTFQLKPSDLKRIQQADLIIWVDSTLEAFMAKSLTQYPDKKILTLSGLPHIILLPLREGRLWQHHHDDEHAHNHADFDPHLWLSTENAKVIAVAIADYLSKIDPEHATHYASNKNKLLKKLDLLKSDIAQQLKNYQSQPFLVYHDAYQYFEKEFHLNGAGTMVLNPHVPLSAHGLNEIKQLIEKNHIQCVFRETEFNDNQIRQFLKGLAVNVEELDPLGYRYPQGPENYFQTMQGLSATLKICLR